MKTFSVVQWVACCMCTYIIVVFTLHLHSDNVFLFVVFSHVCSFFSWPAGVYRGRESAICISHDAGGGFLHGPHQQQHWRQSGGAQTRYYYENTTTNKRQCWNQSVIKYTLFFLIICRYFVREQRQVLAVESSGPFCPGAEGVQSGHHRRRNHAACKLFKIHSKNKQSLLLCAFLEF